eukprot:6224384-Lingulodinium_polyedra.AAC.1
MASLCVGLEKLVVLKDPGFDWGVSGYPKLRRSQGPCRDGLLMHKALLKVVLQAAPKGFPSL